MVKKLLSQEAQDMKVNPSVRSTALTALKKKKKASSPIHILIGLKVPAWSAVAAVFIAFFSVLSFIKNNSADSLTTAKTTNKIDTVYVQQIVHDTIEKQIESKKSAEKKVTRINNKVVKSSISSQYQATFKDSMYKQLRKEMELQELQTISPIIPFKYGRNLQEDPISMRMIEVKL